MTVHPNAKINLGLNVIRQRSDGYHDLETVFYPIPLHDILKIKDKTQLTREKLIECEQQIDGVYTYNCSDYTLRIEGIPIKGDAESNLIIKALRLLKKEFRIPPLYIYLYKYIPSGAGLGGGSSDAAFMMKMLNEQFHLALTDEEIEQRVTTLGADCAFFVKNSPVKASGIGNIFTPAKVDLSGWYLVLVKPDVFVSTKVAYDNMNCKTPIHEVTAVLERPIEEWKDLLINDFEESVFVHFPEIATIKQALYNNGATYAAMSGSGSCVFGLFREKLSNASLQFPGCFYHQSKL